MPPACPCPLGAARSRAAGRRAYRACDFSPCRAPGACCQRCGQDWRLYLSAVRRPALDVPLALPLLVAAAALAALVPLSAGAGWDAAHAETAGGQDAPLPGTVVVADTADDRVRVFGPGGAHAFDIGSRGTAPGEFMAPEGAAISADGLIVVADTGNHRIQVFHPNGTFARAFGSHGAAVGQFASPAAVAFSPQGDLIAVADTGNDRAYIFHVDGTPAFMFGQQGTAPGEFASPKGVAITRDRLVAVADTGNDRVQVLEPDGTPVFEFGSRGSGNGQFAAPHAVDLDREGNKIIVADTGNHRIQVFDYVGRGEARQAAEFSFAAGSFGTGAGKFASPAAAAFDTAGDLIAVADTGNSRVQILDGVAGEFVSEFGGLGTASGQLGYMKYPSFAVPAVPPSYMQGVGGGVGGGVAGATSNLPPASALPPDVKFRTAFAVVDTGNDRIQVFNGEGRWLSKIGSGGTGDGNFHTATSAAYSPSGAMIAVADEGRHRIQVFHVNGTFAFGFGLYGSGTGQFNQPSSVAYSPSGDRIAVADRGNHRVQLFYPDGTFATAFGERGTGDGQFIRPYSASYSPSGDRIIVAHTGTHGAQIFYSDGTFAGTLGAYGEGADQYKAPRSASYSPDGEQVAMTDYNTHSVRVIGAYGTFVDKLGAGGSGTGKLYAPRQTAYSPYGEWLAVSDTGNNRITLFSAGDGTPAGEFGQRGTAPGQLIGPRTVAFAPQAPPTTTAQRGMLAVADTGNDRVQVFYSGGTFAGKFGASGAADGQFNAPQAAAYSPNGRMLAVADTGNDRVQIFDAAGAHVRTIGSPGAADGQFNAPQAVSYSLSGGLLAVADTGNDRVQVFHAGNGSLAFKFGASGAADGQFASPAAAAYSPAGGRIAVADTGNDRVQIFDAAGAHVRTIGSPGAADGQFNAPQAVSYSLSGGLLAVADTGNDRVQVFHAGNGSLAFKFGTAGTGDGQFNAPQAVSYSLSGGLLAIADAGNDRVQVFDATNGTFTFKFGTAGTGDGRFNGPASAAFAGSPLMPAPEPEPPAPEPPAPEPPAADDRLAPGAIAVSERGAHRVQVFHPNGTLDFTFGQHGAADGSFNRPMSVALAPDGGAIAVADMYNDRVQVFGPNGTFAFKFGLKGSADGEFFYPVGVAYSPDGSRLAVADYDNHRVQVFNAATGAHIDTFGGTSSGSGNGQFNTPRAVAYSPDGGLIAVADAFNHRVQVINATTGAFVSALGGTSAGAAAGQFNTPRAVAYSPDGERLATVDRGNDRIQVFDAAGGTVDYTFGWHGSGNRQFNNPTSAAYSADGSLLAVADMNNNRVQVFHAANGTRALDFGSNGVIAGQFDKPASVAFVVPPPPPPPPTLAVADRYNNRVQVFTIGNGTLVPHFTIGAGWGNTNGSFWYPSDVAYSPDGTRIAVVCGCNHPIQIFDAADGDFMTSFGRWGSFEGQFGPYFRGHQGGIDYSHDGTNIAVADYGNSRIQIFDAMTGDFLSSIVTPRGVTDVAYSPDGVRIAVVDGTMLSFYDGGRIQVYYTNGTIDYTLSNWVPTSIDYSPDGTRFAVNALTSLIDNDTKAAGFAPSQYIGFARSIKVFHANGTHDHTIIGSPPTELNFRGVSWSPDGASIATLERRDHDVGYSDRVSIFHANGTLDFQFGGRDTPNNIFNYPLGLAYSPLP